MTAPEFAALQYGNVIRDEASGRLLLVLHTIKNANGETTDIGVIEAHTSGQAGALSVTNAARSETSVGLTDTLLHNVTIQP